MVIGFDAAHCGFVLHLDQIVELVAAGVQDVHTESFSHLRRGIRCPGNLCREVHLDPVASPAACQQTAAGVKSSFLSEREMLVFPENVGAGECGMAAKVHFDRRRQPPKPVAPVFGMQKCCFRKIHLAGHVSHPRFIGRTLKNADGRWISGKRLRCKRIHLNDSRGHGLNYDNGDGMAEVAIQRAGPEHAGEAWRILNEYYDAVDVVVREDRDAFLQYYFGDGAGFWLARREGAVVGCIGLRPLDGLPRAGEVKRLYVQPESRSLGIASLLLDALQQYAASSGYEWLYLDSKDDLKVALAFYEKHGYRHCARYNDNPQATVFMRKRLP